MSIKPVAWMHKDGSVITAEKKKKAERSSSIQGAMVSGYTTPLIPAIPDTHRVVPVELLESAVIAAYLSCPEISLELKAIIDKEPPCPSA